MPYHPPRLESVTEEDFQLYRHVVNGVYCFDDLMLGRLIELAGPDTTFIVLSDHGFHSDHLRPAKIVENRELDAQLLRAWYEQAIAPQLHGRPEFAGYIFGSGARTRRSCSSTDALPGCWPECATMARDWRR
jgi:hypothetical protein